MTALLHYSLLFIVLYHWNIAHSLILPSYLLKLRSTISSSSSTLLPLNSRVFLLYKSSTDTPLLSSRKIDKLNKEIEELNKTLEELKTARQQDETTLQGLEKEFGSEIERVKKEFNRIKERSYEEARELTMKAKVDAVKEILPVTDDYYRAKKIYETLQNENEEKIMSVYDKIFASLVSVLEDFGVTRVVSVGQPFDYTFMEAIMTAPSMEYGPDIVTQEFQVGYKMGDKCIRPAIVVVSTGPGP